MDLVFPMGWLEVDAPFHPLYTCQLEVHKVEILYCQFTMSVFLFFYCHFYGIVSSLSSTLFLFEGIPKLSCTQNTTARDLCTYPSFLYTEPCQKSLRKCLLLNPNSMNSNRN